MPARPDRPRLLYIDDDEGLCALVRRTLARRGFAVSTARDGATGVAMAAGEAYDIVALDHYMPGQDGLATLAQLRDLPSAPPIVYVTGSDESRIAVAALKAGAVDYVVKSGAEDFQDLLANALKVALNQVRLRQERDAAVQALERANTRLEAIVAHQAVLLREVDHRVANSLQLIASLVHMQATAAVDGEARAALRDTQVRIAAIMQVHRRLYTSEDVQNVDMAEYLTALGAELQQSLASTGVHPIRVRAEAITLNPDKAVSLGVVVTELVTNAVKYAYPEGVAGEVRVDLRAQTPGLRLVVEDDGAGIGSAETSAKGTGLGQRVIAAMARSLGSEVRFDHTHRGARAVLAFQP